MIFWNPWNLNCYYRLPRKVQFHTLQANHLKVWCWLAKLVKSFVIEQGNWDQIAPSPGVRSSREGRGPPPMCSHRPIGPIDLQWTKKETFVLEFDDLWQALLAPSKRGLFDVRYFYNVLILHDGTFFPWKSIWWIKVPLRVTFFVWLAALRKIFTLNDLRKQHVIVFDWCCMCKRNREFVNHLLLHCEVACCLCLVECHL